MTEFERWWDFKMEMYKAQLLWHELCQESEKLQPCMHYKV